MRALYIANPDLSILESLENTLFPSYHGGYCKTFCVRAASEPVP